MKLLFVSLLTISSIVMADDTEVTDTTTYDSCIATYCTGNDSQTCQALCSRLTGSQIGRTGQGQHRPRFDQRKRQRGMQPRRPGSTYGQAQYGRQGNFSYGQQPFIFPQYNQYSYGQQYNYPTFGQSAYGTQYYGTTDSYWSEFGANPYAGTPSASDQIVDLANPYAY